jgi:phospholipid/cholesterol/gamma-HCH transport system substrate-binding protein
MKKISREIKIGIVAIITIAVLIWVWNFLKGINIFNATDSYYAVYSDVHGLIESGVVVLNGYKVGNVGSIQFNRENVNRIVVEVNLEEKIKLPRNSVLMIRNSSLVSGIKEIRIVLGEGPGFQEPGDTLIAATEQELSDLIGPIKNKAESVLGQIDSTLAAVNNILDVPTRNHLKSTLANLDRSVTDLSASLEPGGKLNSSFDNFASVTGNLKNNNENISQTLQNISSISDSLQKADIKAVAEKADQALAKLDMTLAKINAGEGTAGKLVANDSLYNNLNSALFSLDSLLIDVKEHPKRYVHFSLFGKKDK